MCMLAPSSRQITFAMMKMMKMMMMSGFVQRVINSPQTLMQTRIDSLSEKSFRSRTPDTLPTLVRETTGCPPVSSIIKPWRLPFFGHVARSDSRRDYHRAVSASLRPPRDWRRPRGRPRTTWLREIDADVQYSRQTSVSSTIHSSWRKANDRVLWQRIIDTATFH